MKKIYFLIILMFVFITTGCATLHRGGYKDRPERAKEATPTESTTLKTDLILARILQKLDTLNDRTPDTTPPAKKKKIKFEPKKKTDKGNSLETRVTRNERRIAEINRTLTLHGEMFLTRGGKYKIARVGFFKPGSAKICCGLEEKIQDAILWGEKEGYIPIKIIGYTDNDGWQGNQKLSQRRAEKVYNRILFHRPKYRNLHIEVIGTGPSVMFGTGSMNRRVMIIFQKKQ